MPERDVWHSTAPLTIRCHSERSRPRALELPPRNAVEESAVVVGLFSIPLNAPAPCQFLPFPR
jgi:hypothetical protein